MKNKILRFFFGYETPMNIYEQSPFISWVVFTLLFAYILWSLTIVLK